MKTIKRFKSLSELYEAARKDKKVADALISTVLNIGAVGLGQGRYGSQTSDVGRAIEDMRVYWQSLVGEYQMTEDAAEEQLLDEFEFVQRGWQ